MLTSHQASTVSATVETGQVIDVDIETYSISVVTQFTHKPLVGIAFATPYQHYANGEGIYFMPEVGSLCWLCWPSDGSRPFVLGWSPAREDNGSLRSNKMGLNPGDIYLGTRDENFIILRRGGIIQIGGGPLSQRMFMPVNNAIKDFCENYSLFALGGDLEWTIDRAETDTNGKRPALLRLKAREYADDQEPVAILEIGSHKNQAQNILSLVIKESGTKGAATKISLEFRKDGSANWTYQSGVSWSLKELSVTAQEKITLTAGTEAKVTGKTAILEASAGNVSVKGATTVDIMAGSQVNVGPQLAVGGAIGGMPVLLADPTLLTWLKTHTHTGVATGSGASGPPATVLVTTAHIAQKLKSK